MDMVPEVAQLLLFQGMEKTELSELLAAAKIHRVHKGEYLFRHGEDIRKFYVITNGAIRKFRETPDGKEITLKLALRGDVVGASHIFESCSGYQWSAVAAEDTALLEFSILGFKEAARKHHGLTLNLLTSMSQNAHMAAIDAEHLVTFSAAQRIACFLLRLCILYDFDPAGFELPYSKTTIASRLGMELETFSRSLQTLKKNGVDIQGSHASIQNLRQLECFVCGHCSIEGECSTRRALDKYTDT